MRNNLYSANDIADQLFSKYYPVETTKISLSLIQELPDLEDIAESKPIVTHGFGANMGVTRTEVCNNVEGIVQMLAGVSRRSVGEGFQTFMKVKQIEQVQLNTASIAELIYKRGTATLIRGPDSITIYNDIGNYLDVSQFMSKRNPNYIAPPEEDMVAFRNLYDILEPIAHLYMEQIAGYKDNDSLFEDDIFTATGAMDIQSVFLNGVKNSGKLLNTEDNNAYDFSRGLR